MKTGHKTKTRILEIANELFYHNGFADTSIGDIVDKAEMSKGNLTYHFKNKQAILEGVVNRRLDGIDNLLEGMQKDISDPKVRLKRFCEISVVEQENLKKFGCPMGTLTGEFSKNQPDLYQISLPMFKRFRTWLAMQYVEMGYAGMQADEEALSMLGRMQGISVVTHAFKDKGFLEREIRKLQEAIG